MKKILSITLAVLIMFSTFAITSSAQSSYNASFILSATVNDTSYTSGDTINVAPGDSVTVKLKFKNDFYLGSVGAQLFYNSSIFTGATAKFNSSGKFYGVCGKSYSIYNDWDKITEKNRTNWWPDYSSSKLEKFKADNKFCYMIMTANPNNGTTVNNLNETLITYTFKVSSTVKSGTTGQIIIPAESAHRKDYKNGRTMCSVYKTSDMTASMPVDDIAGLKYDMSKAVLNFKVSNSTAVELSNETISMNFKDTKQLTANVTKGTVKTVNWKSSDTKVATVDKNGNVTATGKGTATITATTTDGKYSADCSVTVKYSPIQIIIIYVLFGFIWYK